MIRTIMTQCSEALDYIFPIGGGAAGASFGWFEIHGLLYGIMSAALMAFVGALVGYFTKRILDKLLKVKDDNNAKK